MEYTFKPIPEEFQINEKVKQEEFLINGNLQKWKGDFSPVYSTISSTKDYKPTLLGRNTKFG